jgi:hypothetical protein
MKMDKKGVVWDTMIPWIIGIAVLAMVLVLAAVFRDKLIYFGDYIKGLFRS